ncbi:hypothetical protein NUW54_g12606 [Trametes sanguinea]|uniref:Uncharacterized protein n=1 Tax=Trametes sanguinea TaxID=158606 RepID=A0ACC1MXL5_9APHY|nr:hypothetical protein NUW54_g12606 [Trametes sanguinea]
MLAIHRSPYTRAAVLRAFRRLFKGRGRGEFRPGEAWIQRAPSPCRQGQSPPWEAHRCQDLPDSHTQSTLSTSPQNKQSVSTHYNFHTPTHPPPPPPPQTCPSSSLATYGAIRQHPNLILVGGSGFGGADDVWPYLTGDWSVEKFGLQPMPFDGFLFASRVMVAKETHTSSSVKDLIVAASGVDDSQWEGTYTKETGGILTLWKEFDDTVFKLPKEKRAAWLAERRAEIIAKLNKDFAKPWFGWKKDGTVVEDIADMTYEEVTLRMIRLMYVAHQERWIDISLRNLTGDWLRRVEERFAGVNGGGAKASILQSYSVLDKPQAFVEDFFKKYPAATEQLLASEDKAYFLAISQRPGQKPAPFIPVLDANFEVWFKKDSLWAAEDIDAVFDQDPQRVCILQGPVAAKHSIIKDEPIKDLLGNITSKLVEKLVERLYNASTTVTSRRSRPWSTWPPCPRRLALLSPLPLPTTPRLTSSARTSRRPRHGLRPSLVPS